MVLEREPDEIQPFFQTEYGFLGRIRGNRYDNLIEDLQPTLEQIQVSIGDGIEGTR
jgi:hypothetical protein